MSFRKAHPQTLNSLVRDAVPIQMCAQVLEKYRVRAPAVVLPEIYEITAHRGFPLDTAIKIAEKYGVEGLRHASLYALEARRAEGLADAPPAIFDVSPPDVYHRRHERLTALIAEQHAQMWQRKRALVASPELVEQAHRANWERIRGVPPVISPICTKEEFEREGSEMSHCIASYFYDTDSLFGAFDDGISRGSFQIRIRNGEIVQFYGEQNSKMPVGKFRELESFVRQEVVPAFREVPSKKGAA